VWRGPNWLEVGAVIGTGALHLLFLKVLGYHLLFIIAAIGGWAWYVASRSRLDPGRLRDWGFRRAGFQSAFLVTASFTALAIGVMALIGWHRGHLRLHWHMLPLLLLYPVWGVIQQFPSARVSVPVRQRARAEPRAHGGDLPARRDVHSHLPALAKPVALGAVPWLGGPLFLLLGAR
jgi:hypothetical protein